jgi:phytoene dehydrogenase-like protein
MSERILILGGGIDELVAARKLARAGRAVTLIGPSPALPVDGWISPAVASEASALKVEAPDPWAAAPLPQGGYLELSRDLGRSVEAIRRVSERDAARWPEFCERMARLARLFEKIYIEAPPDPLGARFALRARLLGRQGLEDLLRILPMSVAELLDDWFENDTLKGMIGAAAVRHLQQGPRAGGTAFRLIEHQLGNPPGVFRSPRSNARAALAVADAISEAATKIVVREGRVTAVVVGGKEMPASRVVSGLDPRRTLLELADPAWLDPELAREIAHVRRRGVVARLSFTLDRPPPHPNLVIAPSLDYLEKAYDDSKYRRVSRQPYLEARWDGSRVLEVHAQYTPYGVDGRWSEFAGIVGAMLAAHLGGASIVERELQAPVDLERTAGWPQGQAWHAEPGLDQALWMRPLPSLAGYRTPVAGLWLCGPAMHPGAAAPGAAGAIVARQVLAGR